MQKIVQMSAKKVYFQFAECSLSYAKKQKKSQKASVLVLFFLFFSKYVTKRTLVSIFFHQLRRMPPSSCRGGHNGTQLLHILFESLTIQCLVLEC